MQEQLNSAAPKPMVLIILDGWGYRDNPKHNAILAAQTPHWDHLWQSCAHGLIEGSGNYVGLPDGQMGNSEVGHLNLGSGRVVYQDISRISNAIENKEFFANPNFCQGIQSAVNSNKAIHILGLLSPGGVHSHEDHIHALVKLAAEQGASKVYVHAFLDGRDTPPQSAAPSLEKLEELLSQYNCGHIASIIGRYYAMDRDNRWDRIKQAYDLMCHGTANHHFDTALMGLEQAYARGETDEFVTATSIHTATSEQATIKDGDVVIFMNFRADRARELARAFVDEHFDGFDRGANPKITDFISLTEYATYIPTTAAFPPVPLANVLGEFLSNQGIKQLRIAETEKYAHVTFFFNGGKEEAFAGEDRLLIPSPDVATYDLKPEMSAIELTDHLVEKIISKQYGVIICNYANPDMVGHTGNYEATITAIETIDDCLGRIQQALESVGGEMLVTADHGNAELMFDENTQQAHTAHTIEPVPLIYFGRQAKLAISNGSLSDIAPTLLYLMGLDQPKEMTGKPLFSIVG